MHNKYFEFKKQQEVKIKYSLLYVLGTFVGMPILFAIVPNESKLEGLLVLLFVLSIPVSVFLFVRQLFVSAKENKNFLLANFPAYLKEQGVYVEPSEMPDFHKLDLGIKPFMEACYKVQEGSDYVFLYKDEHGDKDFVNCMVFSSFETNRVFEGNVFITLDTDYLFNLFKKNNMELDTMEWNEFEDMLRVETDNGQMAREVLDPLVMSHLYDVVVNEQFETLRMHVGNQVVDVLSQTSVPVDKKNADYLHEVRAHESIREIVNVNRRLFGILK